MLEILPNSFIYQIDNAIPETICSQVISRFEADQAHHNHGKVGAAAIEDLTLKKTTDLYISNQSHWQDIDQLFFNSLALNLQKLGQHLPYFADLTAFSDLGYNIQRYNAGDYYQWHIDSDSPALASRQLVALWYLNDVDSGGETEFKHQQVRITPSTGKLILFPPMWTHEHRACRVDKGVKYIATTWLSFRD